MRRYSMVLGLLTATGLAAASHDVIYPPVTRDTPVVLPRDYGAHPDYRLEWWYVTGWLTSDRGPLGFQITLFRVRLPFEDDNRSRFAARQLIVGHMALSDPTTGRLSGDQRVEREGFGRVGAATEDADVRLGSWQLRRNADGTFIAQAQGEQVALDLRLTPRQSPILQGDQGYSRKGPRDDEASKYVSVPHLAVAGQLTRGSNSDAVQGEAWLDHEWASTLLGPFALGWDWAGLNMDDGSAITVFRVRDSLGQTTWAGGSVRTADGRLTALDPHDVAFEPRRQWRSPTTGTPYPVEMTVTIKQPVVRRLTLRPLFDNQEQDTRPTGGPVYWEGAVQTDGGRGYLELVGYAGKPRL